MLRVGGSCPSDEGRCLPDDPHGTGLAAGRHVTWSGPPDWVDLIESPLINSLGRLSDLWPSRHAFVYCGNWTKIRNIKWNNWQTQEVIDDWNTLPSGTHPPPTTHPQEDDTWHVLLLLLFHIIIIIIIIIFFVVVRYVFKKKTKCAASFQLFYGDRWARKWSSPPPPPSTRPRSLCIDSHLSIGSVLVTLKLPIHSLTVMIMIDPWPEGRTWRWGVRGRAGDF